MTQATVTVKKSRGRKNGEYIRRSRGDKAFSGINLLIMILLLCFFLYPLLNMLSISCSNEYAVLRAQVTFYPIGFNPQAYDLIFKSTELWRSVGNSVFVALIGCLCSLVMLCFAAYPLAFGQFYGKKIYNFMILFYHVVFWRNHPDVPNHYEAGALRFALVTDL